MQERLGGMVDQWSHREWLVDFETSGPQDQPPSKRSLTRQMSDALRAEIARVDKAGLR